MGTTPSRTDSNTVTFRDGPAQWAVSMNESHDPSRNITVHNDVSLDAFFARPIPIYNATWTPGASFTAVSINPWSLYLANTRVSNRISNYRLFSGDMHVKVMVNGNSFYYGRMMVSYAPYWYHDIASSTSLASVSSLVQNSQRLKLFVDPCESQAGDFKLPFLWHADMIDLTTGEFQYLGILSLEELNGLKHANGATSPITVSIFAWMENVKLSAPTEQNISSIAPQAGDEYGSGILSSVSSAVAANTGRMSSMPIIGRYMRATSVAAGAVGTIAKLFGFSRPVHLGVSVPMKQRPLGELATTDVEDGSVKLSVDSKQELTIDPGVVGLGSADELVLSSIAGRETYVNNFGWTTAATMDTLLFNVRVSPIYRRISTGTLGNINTIPACTYAALPFKYWRGTMRYRFQIVASNFHKGRMKVVWDPLFCNVASESNVQYTKIVDISNERDFVMDVAWGQPRSWLECAALTSITAGNTMSTTRFTNSNVYTNGILSIFVLNELSTPNSAVNNDITVNVFMSMCDDCDFAAPRSVNTFSPVDASVQPQSGIEILPQSDVETEQLTENNAPQMVEDTEEFVSCFDKDSPVHLVYMGERIVSFRQLMKRYNVDYNYSSITPGIFSVTAPDFPMKYGYTPYGIRGTSPNKYNVANTTMLRYLAMGFLFYRGGVRRKYVLSTNATSPTFATLQITRTDGVGVPVAPATTAPTLTTTLTLSDTYNSLTPSGMEGMSVSTTRQNQVAEAEIPYYRNVRFSLCRRPNYIPSAVTANDVPFVEDLVHTFSANTWTPATANVFTSLVAGAEDSSFFCFQGCQPFYISPTLV
ncbi:hypothetical protein 2 [Hubei picorna-like virus 1]|uniref:hypothetical protein 2 n=1 Tax=Hubei picorna-like virus 1 TaxID=1923088 RepID=UPI00090A6287|nr:hypothetical protein 2 [Hubei picorna-like virus 1]APG78436.1 hypothetical protein 2 [Hubei picorna-like virus 1]